MLKNDLAALAGYRAEQEPQCLAYTCAELARCAAAKGSTNERDQWLREAFAAAASAGTEAANDYVSGVLVEVLGGRDEAEQWTSANLDH